MIFSFLFQLSQSRTVYFDERQSYYFGTAVSGDVLRFEFSSQYQVVFFASNVQKWTGHFYEVSPTYKDTPAAFEKDGLRAAVFQTENFSLTFEPINQGTVTYSCWIMEPKICGTEAIFMASENKVQYKSDLQLPVSSCIFTPGFGEESSAKITFSQKDKKIENFALAFPSEIKFVNSISTTVSKPFFFYQREYSIFQPELLLEKTNIKHNLWDQCLAEAFSYNMISTHDTGSKYLLKKQYSKQIPVKCDGDISSAKLTPLKGWAIVGIIVGVIIAVILIIVLIIIVYRRKRNYIRESDVTPLDTL